jgi:RNA polymerase sigma-70 factor (ECF subfamily)
VSGNLALQPSAYSHDTPQDQAQELGRLMARVAHGDQEAFTALYDATSSVVYGLALRILRDPGAAEDVSIEVYLQVHAQAEHYDARRGTPLGWITTLTRSRAIDRQRKDGLRKQREAPLELTAFSSKEASPEAQSATREQQRIVRTALVSLTPKQRQVIEIAYFEGLSHAEIAAKLGQPLGTVKTRLRPGLQALRVLLCPFMGEGEA